MSGLPSWQSVRLEGIGLHRGRACAVTLSRRAGTTTLGRGHDRARLGDGSVTGIDRSSSLRLPSGAEVRAPEHLLAAIAGARAFEGLHVEIEGDELPLLDGGAAEFFDAITTVIAEPSRVTHVARVVRSARFQAHGTTLELSPASFFELRVDVDFDVDRFGVALRGSASWRGDRETFRGVIATARTFGAARELAALRARGLAAHVPASAVVALDAATAGLPEYAARDPEEPIRHKLLDAIGDLAAVGAPVLGKLVVLRPSHRGTHGALASARAAALFVVEPT